MSKMIDMTNWKMKQHGVSDSRITVINRGPNDNNGKARWYCKCDCGSQKIFLVTGNQLRSGATKSCGCLQKQRTAQAQFIDMTGWKMWEHGVEGSIITVVSLAQMPNEKHRTALWHCKDEEGYQADIPAEYLRSGDRLSCGAFSNKKSKGEFKIEQLLSKNNIPFIREFRFKNCRDKNQLPFDFYVDNKYLIEYDGEQHTIETRPGSCWHDLQYYQKHDKIKNEYCKQNNIPLIRIPYSLFNDLTIEDLLLETTKNRVV